MSNGKPQIKSRFLIRQYLYIQVEISAAMVSEYNNINKLTIVGPIALLLVVVRVIYELLTWMGHILVYFLPLVETRTSFIVSG